MRWDDDLDLKALEARLERAALVAVGQAGNLVMEESKREVPVDSGDLRDSATVSVDVVGGMPTAALSYGPWYGVLQHENLHHHHPAGKAKFLEDPINGSTKVVARIAATGLRAVLS